MQRNAQNEEVTYAGREGKVNWKPAASSLMSTLVFARLDAGQTAAAVRRRPELCCLLIILQLIRKGYSMDCGPL